MDASPDTRTLHLLQAGCQAGCLGVLIMIGWWMLGSAAGHRSVWNVPNLLATTFYGQGAQRRGFIVPTWAGLALPFAVYIPLGAVFAFVARARQNGWGVLVTGIAFGLTLNWVCFVIGFQRTNPLAYLYMPVRLIAISHSLYGAALGAYPFFLRHDPVSWSVTSDQQVGRGIS